MKIERRFNPETPDNQELLHEQFKFGLNVQGCRFEENVSTEFFALATLTRSQKNRFAMARGETDKHDIQFALET